MNKTAQRIKVQHNNDIYIYIAYIYLNKPDMDKISHQASFQAYSSIAESHLALFYL